MTGCLLQLSATIRKILNSSDNCDEQSDLLYNLDADILPDAGSVTHEEAEAKALGEYEKFWRIQDQTFLSDFDKLIEDLGK